MTSERAGATVARPDETPRRGSGLVAPDVSVGGRGVLLTSHNCFACGQLNAHGLHLELHSRDGRCWTELVLDRRFEGWDGIAHGGILATILDEVMAWAIIERDCWGVTARMSIEYRKPAQVGMRIRGEGWMVEERRRVVDAAGRIVDIASGDLLATAEARYVAAPEGRKRELQERYGFALVPDGRDDERADAPGPVDA